MEYGLNMNPKIATGLILQYMKVCGFKGVTTFWKQIYVLAGYENTEWLLRHERAHLMQMEREGWLWFHLTYTWYLLRYGYINNPYEIEARQAEHLL